jgi:hypothetical protein
MSSSGSARRPFVSGQRACSGESESEKESDGGLCQVSEFVEVELAEPKIGDLVYKPAILGAYSKVIRDIEIGAAAIDESTSGLPVRTSHDELVSGIENECSAASQHVRSDASNVNGDVRDQGAGYFVKIRPKR